MKRSLLIILITLLVGLFLGFFQNKDTLYKPAVLAAASTQTPGSSYEGIDVSNGGGIIGEVKLAGAIPKLDMRQITKDQQHCGGTSRKAIKLIVGPGNAIKDTVIYLSDIKRGKKLQLPAKNPVLDQKKCEYVPHVQVAPLGSTLDILNSDPILHNVHAYSSKDTLFNLALPVQNQKLTKKLNRPGIVDFKCDAGHVWMSAYIVVADHPYYAQSNDKGAFKLSDIPPGKYKLQAWHEFLGAQEKEVNVEAGKEVKINFEFATK